MVAIMKIEDKIKQVEESLALVPKDEQETKHAKVMKAKLAEYKSQLQVEKKNHSVNAEAESTAEDSAPKPIEQDIKSINRPINVIVNVPVHVKGNTKRVEKPIEEDTHFFDSEAAAKEFQYYNRSRLRSKLHSWHNKKNKKTRENREMMYLIVSYFLAQIEGVISYYGKPEYKEILRKKVYSLGEKDSKKTYCFDMEKLRKDFDF